MDPLIVNAMVRGALSNSLCAVAPVIGLSIGRKDDKTTWRVDFTQGATNDHRRAAQAIVDAFDWDGEAASQEKARALKASDQDFVSICEDVIDVLIAKKVFTLDDLPIGARAKYEARKDLRKGMK